MVGYGDLNEGTGPGEFDGGTDARAMAPPDVKPMRSGPNIDGTGVQGRCIATINRSCALGVQINHSFGRCLDTNPMIGLQQGYGGTVAFSRRPSEILCSEPVH